MVDAKNLHSISTTADGIYSDAASDSIRNGNAKMASGIIISVLGDSPLRVVLDADENPALMLKLLDGRYV